jgi:hypothetical protein
MASLVDRLKTAAAQSIDGRSTGGTGQPGHQRDDASNVKTLLALLLSISQDDVFDLGWIDVGPLDQSFHHSDRQIVGADVAKNAPFVMGTANRGATTIDYNSSIHGFLGLKEKGANCKTCDSTWHAPAA